MKAIAENRKAPSSSATGVAADGDDADRISPHPPDVARTKHREYRPSDYYLNVLHTLRGQQGASYPSHVSSSTSSGQSCNKTTSDTIHTLIFLACQVNSLGPC